MFPKVIYPEKIYERVELEECGLSFQKLVGAELSKKTTFFNESIDQLCWFNLVYTNWDATVHYTYYPIDEENSFNGLVGETFKLAYEHTGMASAIKEIPLQRENSNVGFAFKLLGPVASPYQFYISDSTHHFLRGSVYFNTRPNPDSLAPILEFIEKDLDIFVNTYEWR